MTDSRVSRLRWGAASDVGQVRQVNQDRLSVAEGLFVVADGMGGHQAGEVAAALTVEAFADVSVASVDELVAIVHQANDAIIDSAMDDDELRGMGTTVTSLAIIPGEPVQLVAVNVGDSRIYVLREGSIEQVTVDHSLVEDMRREGRITAEEAETHPRRNVLTRALGIERDLDVDVFALPLQPGERFVLCSDGLTNEVTDDGIAATLRRFVDPQQVADELVRQANENGGRDNITVVVVDVVDPDADPDAPLASMTAPPFPASDTADVLIELNPSEREAPSRRGRGVAPAGPVELQARRRRGFGLRGSLLLLAILGVAIVAGWALYTAARGTYFVGFDQSDRVVIYQGRPGGILWFDPTVEEATGFTITDVRQDVVDALRDGVEYGSLDEARAYVERVVAAMDEAEDLAGGAESSAPTSGERQSTPTSAGSPSRAESTALPPEPVGPSTTS